MKESLHFVYDNIHSSEMGVMQINTESGLFKEQFLANKKINEEFIRGNDKPYFYGVEYDPLSFRLEILFDNGFDDEKVRKVARWLDQPIYKPFYTQINPDRVFLAISVDSSEHIHNGIKEGYLVLNMRCNAPYTYSPVYTEFHSFEENSNNGMDYTFNNNGSLDCKPYMTVEMLEDGTFSIVNLSNGGQELKFTDLVSGEILTIDNEKEDVETSLENTYRYDNFNGNYLSLVSGNNYLKIYGKCQIEFKYHYKSNW